MEIEGKLHIKITKELNQAGQAPIEISFIGPDGIKLDVLGVRFKNGTILDALATTQRGWVVYHTHFSDALQHAIINGLKSKDHEKEYSDRVQKELMEKRRAQTQGS